MSAPCGTRSAYTAGCRCDECTAANRAYITAWRHRTGRSDPALDNRLRPSPHGSLNRYLRYGCRCDECREANRAAKERWKRKNGVQPVPQRAAMKATRWPQYAPEESA